MKNRSLKVEELTHRKLKFLAWHSNKKIKYIVREAVDDIMKKYGAEEDFNTSEMKK